MDAKDLRTQSALSDRHNEGSKYAQSGGIALQCDRNKTYQDIGSMAKVEVQSARPCAVIGPDRIVPPHAASEPYMKKSPGEPWPCADNTYRRPPEYPRKLSNYANPIRNISPRQTYQENMQRIMVPTTYNSVKTNDNTNYAQIPDRNIALSKNIKLNVPPEAKYCDVPYAVNPNSNEQKNVRNPEMCVSSVNPSLSRTAPHGWPSGSVNIRPARSYGASELYQYQEYQSCAGPRPIVTRPHRTHPEEPGYVYAEPYYPDGNIRFKPYPSVKDRYPPGRYDYIGNYTNPFHPPPSYPPHKYDLQKSMPHPFSPYGPVKYLDNRISEPILDGFQRNQQGNYNMPYPNQVIHPNYGTVIGNCSQNKMHPYPPDNSIKTVAPNKLPYDNSNKTYLEYDNSRPKIYPPSDSYFVSEMGRLHPMKSQVLMPNYPNLNMHSGPPNPYYKKDNAQMKNFEYMAHLRNMDPTMNIHNPMMRHAPIFSPNTLAISPTDSSASNDNNQSLGASQEDCGYVSQSSTASARSMESGINRLPHEYYRRYYDSRYGHLVKNSPMMAKTELLSGNTAKDKKDIDVRQFFQMWNEGDEEAEATNSKEIATKMGSSNDSKLSKKHEFPNNHEQLYVLGLVNVPSEELSKYEHLQTVSKLPENIKGYNSIELLNQFEEAIESSNMSQFKPHAQKDNFQMSLRGVSPKQVAGILPRPVSPLDVEAKISQSVIHKEVGCNFEIKPCSPKMLNVDIAAPVQNILVERVIEKVANPVSKSHMLNSMDKGMDCDLIKRQDHRLNMNDNVRGASCKMINTQYSNINPIDPIKSSYSLQDLESNSGLCLASLPQLDNDIELNFPEVNQQFINANRGEAPVLTSSPKDLPALEVLDQSVNEIKNKDSDPQVIGYENKVNQTLSNAEPEKEVSKLSKYRKTKPNTSEDYERKSLVTEEQLQINQNAIRTDSVIIKNPENLKKYDDNSEFPSNCFNEPQQAPMNLTSQVNCDNNDKKESGIENEAYIKVKETQSIDIAIDFSLNKNNVVSEYNPMDTELEEKDNSIQEIVENNNQNKTCDEDPSENLIFNTKNVDREHVEDGFTDNCNSKNDVDHFGASARDTENNISNDFKQETSDFKYSSMSQNESDTDIKKDDEENIDNAKSDEYINMEGIITSDNAVVESLLNESSRECGMEDYNNDVPGNKLCEDIKKDKDVGTCELNNEHNLDLDKELEMMCTDNNTQREFKQTLDKQAETDIESKTTLLDDDKNESVLLFSPHHENSCQTNLIHEESKNAFEKTASLDIPNLTIANLQNTLVEEDVINEQVNSVTSNDVLNDHNQLSNPTEDIETNEIECYDPKEPYVENTEINDWDKISISFDKEIKSNGTIRRLQPWSKKMCSPWIQNLLLFSEGNVNVQRNLEINIDIITEETYIHEHVEKTLYDNQNVKELIEEKKVINDKDIVDTVSTCNNNTNNITSVCHSVDEIETEETEPQLSSTGENNVLNFMTSSERNHDINEIQTNTGSHKIEPLPADVEDHLEISDINNSVCDDQNKSVMSPNRESMADENKAIIMEPSSVPETKFVCDDIENQIQKLELIEPFHTEETYNNSFQEEGSVEIEIAQSDNIIENTIVVENSKTSCYKTRCNDIEALFKRQRPLKRSLSDSALHLYNVDEIQQKENDAVQLVLPIKRRKFDKLESVDICSIMQHNRRNSISAICNEDDVSFCILIDNSCIITEEENEEQKVCYTQFSEECLIQNDSTNPEDEENIEPVDPVISIPEINVRSEYSDSFTLDCDEDKALDSWVEDVACVETVISDDVTEDIVLSRPPSSKECYFSENDESGVFSSCEHTDKVKYIYGEKMCSDDAQYLETLYKTPQMDVNKALNSRETQVIGESEKYYDKDSLEKVLSESNGKEPYSFEFINSIMPMSVSNCNTPDDKENIMDIFSPPQSNLNCEDIELNHDHENLLPESMFSHNQDDTVHSCESSIDDVFTYTHELKEENANGMTSSSPEVSSTTSEERNSGILLKITNYKGSRISQINGIRSVNNSPSCKFTEEKDYLHSHSNFTKNRPLLTKAAQKYIPPLKESIRDLKVKLTLPQHSLMKLKKLKTTKDIPKPIKQNNNNIMSRIPKKPKPKFEDVLMSIDEIQFKKHKENTKKAKKSIPKVVIKKTQNGSHYASTSHKDEFNPDLTGRKWQPWVFLEKNIFIDKMAIRKKTKAIYSHRKKSYVLAEKFKKYKAVNNAKFVISQPKTDNSSSGLKYTIRLKHSY